MGSALILKVSAYPKTLLHFTHQKLQVLKIFFQFLLLSSEHFLLPKDFYHNEFLELLFNPHCTRDEQVIVQLLNMQF